ncbi:MAG: ADP-ribosylglycohydrolase-domain-containing protein [Monoraphidium minutum]|nr:MAG: ADP-ribosylglycohydrolase-domain-containing protein [Monoraphidium minutum]
MMQGLSPSVHLRTASRRVAFQARPGTSRRSVRSLTVTAAHKAMSPEVVDRVRGALFGIFIADALSMPVHWYYDVGRLKRDFGNITTYQAPKDVHPGSIMSLSNTGGHGRGDQKGRIIGDVINHGKHEFWGKSNVHYHQGMKAGENTLNALCARVVLRDIAANGGSYSPASFLQSYVKFMTTPGSHNDTYAESFHRDFFKNWAAGVPPEECVKGTEGHNTAQIGGFVMLPPVVFANMAGGRDAARKAALEHLALTHDSSKLAVFAGEYAGLLYDLATGATDLRTATVEAAKQIRTDLPSIAERGYDDTSVIHGVFGSACYITDSYPSMLYLAYKHADSFEGAVLANTNAGGENCHRGAALGALMGAALGEKAIPRGLLEGLADYDAIKREVDAFCDAALGADAPAAAGAAAGEL